MLKRREDEQLINDYNPALIFAWNGNVDVQFVSEDNMAIIDYVTAYISKSESKTSKEFDDCVQGIFSSMDKGSLMKMAMNFLKNGK